MPKKDTSSAVLGMLSTVGAQTRSPAASAPQPEPPAVTPPATPEPTAAAATGEEPAVSGPVATLPINRMAGDAAAVAAAPRTLRLRPGTADKLRAAWLEAKRDDVLLTAQDFASSLMDDALARYRRRRAASSSSG
jgi:hypothetical protein